MIRLEFPPMELPISMGGGARKGRKTLSDSWQEGIIDPTIWTKWKIGGGAIDLDISGLPSLRSTTPFGTWAGIVFNKQIVREKAWIELDMGNTTGQTMLMLCSVATPTTVSGDIDQDFIRIGIDKTINRILVQRRIAGATTTDLTGVNGNPQYSMGLILSDLATNTYIGYVSGNPMIGPINCGALLQSGYLHIYATDQPNQFYKVAYLEDAYLANVSGF